jgi:hypothetical protein
VTGASLLYVLLTHGAMAAVVALAYASLRPAAAADDGEPPRRPVAEGAPLFLLVVTVALALFRWPVLTTPVELAPDESIAVARAARLAAHGDGAWVHLPLAALLKLGYPIHWFTGRVVGLLALVVGVGGLHLGAKRAWGAAAARFGVLPVLAFFAWAGHAGYLHYSPEQVGVGLLGVGFALTWSATRERLWLAGVAGLPIFAGLMVLVAELGSLAWVTPAGGLTDEPGSIGFFLGEAQLLTLAAMVLALAIGAWSLVEPARRRQTLVRLSAPAILVVLALGFALAVSEAQRRHVLPFALALGALGVAATGTLFHNGSSPLAARARTSLPVGAVVVIALVGWLGSWKLHTVPAQLFVTEVEIASSPPGEKLRELLVAGDSLAVWGFAATYQIETQTTPATRDVAALELVLPGEPGAAARARFAEDVRATWPAIVLDTVAPGVRADQTWPRAAWPPVRAGEDPGMRAVLEERYTKHLELQPPRTRAPMQMWVLKERVEGLNWLPTK